MHHSYGPKNSSVYNKAGVTTMLTTEPYRTTKLTTKKTQNEYLNKTKQKDVARELNKN